MQTQTECRSSAHLEQHAQNREQFAAARMEYGLTTVFRQYVADGSTVGRFDLLLFILRLYSLYCRE